MKMRKFFEASRAGFGKEYADLASIGRRGLPKDEVQALATGDQGHHGVVFGLQALGQFADRRPIPPRKAPDLQEQLVLQGRDAVISGNLFAESQEPAQGVTKRRQLFELRLGHGAARGLLLGHGSIYITL